MFTPTDHHPVLTIRLARVLLWYLPTLIDVTASWQILLWNHLFTPFISSVRPLFYLLLVLLSLTLFRLVKKARTKITLIPIKPVYIHAFSSGRMVIFIPFLFSALIKPWFDDDSWTIVVFPGLMFVWLNEKVLTEFCPQREQKTVKSQRGERGNTRKEGGQES